MRESGIEAIESLGLKSNTRKTRNPCLLEGGGFVFSKDTIFKSLFHIVLLNSSSVSSLA